MQGILRTKKNTFAFRDDMSDEFRFWGWDIHDCGDRIKPNKWEKLPRGNLVLFNLGRPPRTVNYIPIMD